MSYNGEDRKDRVVAAILAFFVGGFGAHKFYLRQPGAWLYLIFCWTGIPHLLALFSGIHYLLMTQREFDAIYNSHLSAPPTFIAIGSGQPAKSHLEQLDVLHKLKSTGAISEQEYEIEKAKILSRSHGANPF